jgi:hypothetical protein
MTILRWILGIVGGLLAAGSVISFVIFILADIDLWLKRARNLRRLFSAVALFWFNLEIWRHVALVIIYWSDPASR